MQNNKLFTALRTLDKRELTAFRKYLEGNYGGQKIALAVFKYIKAFHPNYSDKKKLGKAYAYMKIFNADILDRDTNNDKLLNALSDLNLWLNDFWLWNKARDGSLESQALWLMVAKQRGLKSEYDKQYKNIREHLAASENKSVNNLLAGLLANYLFYYSPLKKTSSPDVTALFQCAEDLDNYYAIAKLKIACETANIRHLLHKEIPTSFLTTTKDVLKWSHLAEQPLYQVYREIYLLIFEGNHDSFFKIEAWVSNNHYRISALELHDIISYLNNYAARLLRLDERKNAPIIHNINKFAFLNGFFQHKGEITPVQFNNVVNIACNQGDLDWANHFIVACSIFIKEDQREEAVTLANAIVLFEQKQFRAAADLLFRIDCSDIAMDIRARSLTIRCWFELKEEDLFKSNCHKFEQFLYRKREIRPELLRATLNFIRLLQRIYEDNTPSDKLIEKITSTKELYYREWLLEKTSNCKSKFAAQKRKSR